MTKSQIQSNTRSSRRQPWKVEPWRKAVWETIGLKVHPGQARLMNAIIDHPYVQCDAGRSGGKSYFAGRGLVFPELIRPQATTRYEWEWPRLVLLVAPQQGQTEIIFQEIYTLVEKYGVPLKRDRENAMDIITPWGSRVRCMSGENAKGMRGYPWNLVVIDEIAYLKKGKYTVNEVLKGTVMRRKGKIVQIGSPEEGGWDEEAANMGDDPKIPSWGHVNFTSIDNWFMPWIPDFIADERLQGIPEDIIQREYFARRVPRTGLVYQEYKKCIKEFDRPAAATWIRGIDFGFSNPFVCLVIARVGNRLLVWDEYYRPGANDLVHCSWLKIQDGQYRFDFNVADTEDPGAIDLFVTQGVKGAWVKYEKPNVLPRITLLRRLMGQDRVWIHPRCTNLIRECGLYRYPNQAETRNPSETPMDKDNHALDALGYVADYLFRNEVHMEIARRGKQNEALDLVTGYV